MEDLIIDWSIYYILGPIKLQNLGTCDYFHEKNCVFLLLSWLNIGSDFFGSQNDLLFNPENSLYQYFGFASLGILLFFPLLC